MSQALPADTLLLAEVFDKVPSAIIVLDEQGCVRRANQSASKLLGLDSLENERWVELVSKVFRPRQDDGHEISTKDGRRLQVITLDLQQGQLIQMTDLTETRALQDKIAHMERLSSLGKMAASLAHQIRTPLSAAMLYAANLGNANLQPMARKRFQEKLMGRLEALEAQVSDILMFARSNEQTVTEIDASQLVDQTANNVSAVLSKGDAELETIADTGLMPILGNATALTGALSNLVANAVEAGANKIILKLTKDEELNTITFSVANNGPKIPEELKQKIFEPFFTSKSAGTGLGLAVVTAVTKVHQGTLRLDSWNDEYATVFSITIPLYMQHHIEGASLRNTVSSLRSSLNEEEEEVVEHLEAEAGAHDELHGAEHDQHSMSDTDHDADAHQQDYADDYQSEATYSGTASLDSQDNTYHQQPQGYESDGYAADDYDEDYAESYDDKAEDSEDYDNSAEYDGEYEEEYSEEYAEDKDFAENEDKGSDEFKEISYTAIGVGQIHPSGEIDSGAIGTDGVKNPKRGQIGAANAVLVAAAQGPNARK